MKLSKKHLSLLLGLTLTGACDTYDFPEQEKATAGEADFSKMISIGNSLTAGYMNGALYNAGQQASYPSILANQMKAIGGGDFNQPDINSENGYYGAAGQIILGRLYLKGTTSPKPTPKIPGELPTPYTGDKTALNNFGVPGVTIQTVQTPDLGNPSKALFNPLYARFASSPGTSTLLGDAAAALANGGTFFTFWLGNNDVLGYATGGASNPAYLTSEGAFNAAFNNALTTMLTANTNAKGAVANIPDVSSIPFFSTIAYNAVPLDASTASAVNNGFAGYNAVIDYFKGAPFNYAASDVDARKISFAAKANNEIVIQDETLNNYADEFDILKNGGYITAEQRAALVPYEQVREAKSSDFITLTAGAVLGTSVGGNPLAVYGISVPLGDQYVLLPSEAQEVQTKVDAFNQVISSAVAANSDRLVLVDVHAILKTLKQTGIVINGSAMNATISPPFGGFSLDGVHPNARGMAFIANEFIKAINSKFGSNIPLCNPNDYASNELPIP